MKILIVDDSRSSRLMVKTCLSEVAGEIEEADGAETALDKYKAGRFDLVIMDIHMPRIDGYEAIRRIRSFEASGKRAATPIVALTAMDIAQAAPKTKAVGATICMGKPVKQASLIQVIQSLTLGEAADAVLARPSEPAQPTSGRFKKLFGLGRGPETENLEQSELRSQRPEFLAEKKRELGIAKTALESGNLELVRVLAHRLKGEGANFGFKEVTGFGAALATAIEGRDLKTARSIVDKLQAFVINASAS